MPTRKLHFWLELSTLILSLIMAVIIIIASKSLPVRLPLFYSLAWGEGQLATPEQFLIIPACISMITLLNLIISWQLHASQLFFKNVIFFSSIIVSLILTIAFIKIISMFLL